MLDKVLWPETKKPVPPIAFRNLREAWGELETLLDRRANASGSKDISVLAYGRLADLSDDQRRQVREMVFGMESQALPELIAVARWKARAAALALAAALEE